MQRTRSYRRGCAGAGLTELLTFIVVQAMMAAIAQGLVVTVTGSDTFSPRQQWSVESLQVDEKSTEDAFFSQAVDGRLEVKNADGDVVKVRGSCTFGSKGFANGIFADAVHHHPHQSNPPTALTVTDNGFFVDGILKGLRNEAGPGSLPPSSATLKLKDDTILSGAILIFNDPTRPGTVTFLFGVDGSSTVYGVDLKLRPFN